MIQYPAKTIATSAVTLGALMNPQDANPLGNVHGGVIMKLVDETGGIVAMRHAGMAVVTVVVDSMTFLKPILVGNLVLCSAELTYAGKTSMEVRVEVHAENVFNGERTLTNAAYLVYVALDGQGRPHPVPPLEFTTPEEIERAEQAAQRQARRKQQR
ncbi:MAG: acyl-CoA thioesterase [Phototrophicaceae bacterium]|jgi:uncharacterized protein (TIGR00369 family)